MNIENHTKRPAPTILLKIFDKQGRMVDRIGSHKTRRIFSFFEAGNFKDCLFDVSVNYHDGSYNKGVYELKKDFRYALRAFLEK